jgi:predicted aconitase with swiveling domain
MRILILLLLSILVTPMSFGSAMTDIHGVILDVAKRPIAYANVVLLNTDSTFINGCTTNDKGEYSLSNIPK